MLSLACSQPQGPEGRKTSLGATVYHLFWRLARKCEPSFFISNPVAFIQSVLRSTWTISDVAPVLLTHPNLW